MKVIDEKNEKKERKDNKILKIIKNYSVELLIVCIVIIIIIFGFKYSNNFKTQEKTTTLGLRDVGELVTQTCYATVIEDSKNNRDFFKLFDFPFTTSRQIFSYDFEVDASINFEEIDSKIDHKKKTITIILPHATVYKTTLKPMSLKVYLDEDNLFSRIDLKQHNEALEKMEKQAAKDCQGNGLIEAADKNAKQIITSVIKSNKDVKDYKVYIKYKDGSNEK